MSYSSRFTISLILFITSLASEKLVSDDESRDYWYCETELDPNTPDFIVRATVPDNAEEDGCFPSASLTYCAKHYISGLFSDISEDLLSQIPTEDTKCARCKNKAIYFGYIDPRFKRYSSHVIRQITYSNAHKDCSCYWPELSQEAAETSDQAYQLFDILFHCTPLVKMLENDLIADEFRNTAFSSYPTNNPVPLIIARQFRFSHYHRLINDLETLAAKHFDKEEFQEVKEDLYTILGVMALSFRSTYKVCLKNHPNDEIKQELAFTMLFVPNLDDEDAEEDWEIRCSEFFDKLPMERKYLGRRAPSQKALRLPVLNIRPLFRFDYNESFPLEGRDIACAKILKNLMIVLYKNEKFYKEAKDVMPDFEDRFIEKLVIEAKKRAESGTILPKAGYLATLELDNELMSYTRYKMFTDRGGHFWLSEQPSMPGRYALQDFLSIKTNSGYLASVWHAPYPLLMAIFQDESVVEDVMKTREEISQAMQEGDDQAAMRNELRRRFSDKLGDIDPKFIDFRINRQIPCSKR